ncbi:MAG: hypothetical protein IKK38_08255 [Spirochaetaceae bacterium]|nr:hypothetical protein [Spirochaetaceae bacterium]
MSIELHKISFFLFTNARSLTLRLFSEKARRILDSLDLEQFADRHPQSLSGGHCNVGDSKLILDAMFSWLNER